VLRDELGLEHHVPHPRGGWPRSTTIHMPRSNAPRDGSGKTCELRAAKSCRRIHGGRYHRRDEATMRSSGPYGRPRVQAGRADRFSAADVQHRQLPATPGGPYWGSHAQETPTSQGPGVTRAVATHAHLRQERMTSVEGHVPGANSGRPRAPAAQLRNGNPSGPTFGPGWPGRICGARTRAQRSCANPAMPNGRCRMHGGKSTGSRTRKQLSPEMGQDERVSRTAKPSKARSCAGAFDPTAPGSRAKIGARPDPAGRRKAPQERTRPSCKKRSKAGRSRAALERALYPGSTPLYEQEVEALLNTPVPFSFWWDVVVPIALLCLAIWKPVLLVHLIIDCIAHRPGQPKPFGPRPAGSRPEKHAM
jgi:hypothetical protein